MRDRVRKNLRELTLFMPSASALKKSADPIIAETMIDIGEKARSAAKILARVNTETKNAALLAAALAIEEQSDMILKANTEDATEAKNAGLSEAMIDRMLLNEKKVAALAGALRDIVALPDPVGRELWETTRPNGLRINRVSTPLGVIGMIYESRPNVTADAGALALIAGNAVILRGGSECVRSNRAIHAALQAGLRAANLPVDAITLVPTQDRAAVGYMLANMAEYIDVIIPRGGKSLVGRVQSEARVPVLAHLEGICHTYIDGAADLKKAIDITVNAKLRRTGVCGATETLLIDAKAEQTHLVPILEALTAGGCEIRGDAAVCAAYPQAKPATEEDWRTEYLDKIIAVRLVDGADAAIEHIESYGSGHTECVVTENDATAEHFLRSVNSAIVTVNASTQFADGGEFGMGAEIGIATGRIHARGPVGLEQLTTFKYQVRGNGQTRPL